ncbi:hypothetical protein L1987_18193 [Smallanthus sonchifolius]|uniref:Uncharacterized protein n=1 Tax=Smallanthus sonchifolius TaxID=185202 RepID=A0ACB9J181_9ASTR|nr:hypothetical protein L1987_18193 [Smallanthus sonchifolius]
MLVQGIRIYGVNLYFADHVMISWLSKVETGISTQMTSTAGTILSAVGTEVTPSVTTTEAPSVVATEPTDEEIVAMKKSKTNLPVSEKEEFKVVQEEESQRKLEVYRSKAVVRQQELRRISQKERDTVQKRLEE